MRAHEALALGDAAEAVDAGEVGSGAGFEDVGAEAAASDFLGGVVELDVDFAEGLLALGDGTDARRDGWRNHDRMIVESLVPVKARGRI